MNYLILMKFEHTNSLYYGDNYIIDAEIAKWYGGRLENGYVQACRGSNPLPGVDFSPFMSSIPKSLLINQIILLT